MIKFFQCEHTFHTRRASGYFGDTPNALTTKTKKNKKKQKKIKKIKNFQPSQPTHPNQQH